MDSLLQFDATTELMMSNNNNVQSVDFTTDPNNNDDFETNVSSHTKGDKYSLRPRSMRRVTETLVKSNNNSSQANQTNINNNITKSSNKTHKPKQKPAPLSKYRRKTANARERNRMREINQAFESLRRAIPQMATTSQPAAASPSNEKLTKITTLRLAMKYISSLSAALKDSENGFTTNLNFMDPSFSDCSDLDCLLLESDGESLSLSDHSSSLLASPDFPESSLSPVDFGDPSTLPSFMSNDFDEPALEHPIFSDFLLT